MMQDQSVSTPSYPLFFRLPGSTWKALDNSVASALEQQDGEATHLRQPLADYLLSSLQMQNLVVLAGSGTSYDADGPSMAKLWAECTKDSDEHDIADLLRDTGYEFTPQPEKNIEELLSRCDAVLQILDHAAISSFKKHAISTILAHCKAAGADISKLHAHITFLRRLARRRARDARLKLFTTNYDRCFERAAGHLGLVALDGFSFSYPRHFDPVFFDYDLVRRGSNGDVSAFVPGVFQYFKLHGSVDWAQVDEGTVIIDPDVRADNACLIYPASTKFRLSFQQPHLELMGQYLSALRQPNTCLLVLGFGFNDDHLSGPMLAAIEANPHLRVVVVNPGAKSDGSTRSRWWRRLDEHIDEGSDVAYVAATFTDFVPLIPDLRALSPAERLHKAVNDAVNEKQQ